MSAAITILIVEDEAVLAMDLTDLLEEEGYTVVGTANNGLRACGCMSSSGSIWLCATSASKATGMAFKPWSTYWPIGPSPSYFSRR